MYKQPTASICLCSVISVLLRNRPIKYDLYNLNETIIGWNIFVNVWIHLQNERRIFESNIQVLGNYPEMSAYSEGNWPDLDDSQTVNMDLEL